MMQARGVIFDQPDGYLKDFAIGSLAGDLAEIGELDGAISLKPAAQHKLLQGILAGLSDDNGNRGWFDSGGIKITIGGPSLSPKDKTTAREALPKFAALARSSGDAKSQARTLSIVAHLQAGTGDFAELWRRQLDPRCQAIRLPWTERRLL